MLLPCAGPSAASLQKAGRMMVGCVLWVLRKVSKLSLPWHARPQWKFKYEETFTLNLATHGWILFQTIRESARASFNKFDLRLSIACENTCKQIHIVHNYAHTYEPVYQKIFVYLLAIIHVHKQTNIQNYKNIQAYKQRSKQASKQNKQQTNKRTNGQDQTNKRTYRQTDRQTNRHTYRHI